MIFEIKDWRFEEVECCVNKLQFFSNGMSVIQVDFDEHNNPKLRYLDGALYWRGLPNDVEKELKDKIKQAYPQGFKSRI